MWKPLAILAVMLTAFLPTVASAWDPWDFERPLPDRPARRAAIVDPASESTHPVKAGLGGMLTFFQQVVSPLDGPKCPFYPTCSQYSREAVGMYGPFWGVLLTADRFMRETHGVENSGRYPLVFVGKWRPFDPPERNWLWHDEATAHADHESHPEH